MSKYLAMLKSENIHTTSPTKLPKLMNGNSVGFVGSSHDPIPQIRDVANDWATLPDDCIGTLIDDESGAHYLPWAPYMQASDVHRMRRDLAETIVALADLERWPEHSLKDVFTRAMRGPLSALASDLGHFASRLQERRAELAVRGAIDRIARARP
ncbi:hypothetical protein ACFSHT_24100 [Paraburkholderia silviterrae]|uniref:Uncharacterized protein n=1 Tax=Paraburkholderia silviterrae TaxID=2528715 RepID=A0A4R5MB72_9BURK|nr:hypothetical protein [Paraburkholderia silviterrae]TDG24042.1 hypothetical protein EYW47_11050 [Paraburkholderia silviterrae]